MSLNNETSSPTPIKTDLNTLSPTVDLSSPKNSVIQEMNPTQESIPSFQDAPLLALTEKPLTAMSSEELSALVQEWRTLATSAQTLRAHLAKTREGKTSIGEQFQKDKNKAIDDYLAGL